MNHFTWKHWLLIILAIPVLSNFAAHLGRSSAQHINNQETATSEGKKATPKIRVVVSSQDAEGVTASDLDMNFLRNLESYTVESIKAKAKKERAAQGYTGAELAISSEALYVEAGKTKLAVIRLRTSDNSFSVLLFGILGDELKRIGCIWALPDTIPITHGVCGEKIKEVFGAMIGQ